jgi:hypothetical protein
MGSGAEHLRRCRAGHEFPAYEVTYYRDESSDTDDLDNYVHGHLISLRALTVQDFHATWAFVRGLLVRGDHLDFLELLDEDHRDHSQGYSPEA